MRSLIQCFFTVWTKFCFFFSSIRLLASHGVCFGIRCRNQGKGNEIDCHNGRFSDNKILFQGNHNRISCIGKITHSTFQIEGDDNVVEVDTAANVCASSFFLRGDHCRIVILNGTRILGMTAVCQGQNNLISIGKDCLFSSDIDLWASDTHTIYDENGNICNHSQPIHIGDHVWLGKGVAVLKGCSIGDDTVVGMRSLVTRDLPDHVIAAGSPAKVIRSGIMWDKKKIDVDQPKDFSK